MANENLFLDTSGLLCLHDEKDFRNVPAIEFFTNAEKLITTNYVLAEFVPLSFVRGKNRQETLSFRANGNIRFIKCKIEYAPLFYNNLQV